MKTELKKELSPVEWLIEQLEEKGSASENVSIRRLQISIDVSEYLDLKRKAKEMEEDHKGYTESDMRSYATYILNNPVIEPSQWRKIYSNR